MRTLQRSGCNERDTCSCRVEAPRQERRESASEPHPTTIGGRPTGAPRLAMHGVGPGAPSSPLGPRSSRRRHATSRPATQRVSPPPSRSIPHVESNRLERWPHGNFCHPDRGTWRPEGRTDGEKRLRQRRSTQSTRQTGPLCTTSCGSDNRLERWRPTCFPRPLKRRSGEFALPADPCMCLGKFAQSPSSRNAAAQGSFVMTTWGESRFRLWFGEDLGSRGGRARPNTLDAPHRPRRAQSPKREVPPTLDPWTPSVRRTSEGPSPRSWRRLSPRSQTLNRWTCPLRKRCGM